MRGPRVTPRSVLRFARWYVRELTGAAGYDRYLARHSEHSHEPPLSRRDYERRRTEQQMENPGTRCC
ncbi:CstA-like transporter-associated (seleno)protein [Actinomadura sp. 6N118]|uniref:CstA-like transporter-associated (seleno)protein n=1 Tax=Actinomadura sp. 6N118 TaxID=3375151 RepID=UPI0037921DD2